MFRTICIALVLVGLAVMTAAAHAQPSTELRREEIAILGNSLPATAGFDSRNVVRSLTHFQAPFGASAANLDAQDELTPSMLADAYIQKVGPILSIEDRWLGNVAAPHADETPGRTRLARVAERSLGNQTVVTYEQSHEGIPIWRSAVSVTVVKGKAGFQEPLRVTSSINTTQSKPEFDNPGPKVKYTRDSLDPKALAMELGLPTSNPAALPHNLQKRLVWFPFDPERRIVAIPEGDEGAKLPKIPVPPVPDTIRPGRLYKAIEVNFTLPLPLGSATDWTAVIEVRTGAVLYLEPHISTCGALQSGDPPAATVYLIDPISSTGNFRLLPSAAISLLDHLKNRVNLLDLSAPEGTPPTRPMKGKYAELKDMEPPNIAPPRLPLARLLDGGVESHEFAAANSYYHVEDTFRRIEELLAEEQIPLQNYFEGTRFPVPVDHRWFSVEAGRINAKAPPDAERDGSGGFYFAYAHPIRDISIAADRRVVLHEFGHALLENRLHRPNFPFAHSPGDSISAILLDSDSKAFPRTPAGLEARERFLTFPWTLPNGERRHDRPIIGGWGWGGKQDKGMRVRDGYDSEQILATSLFRFYRGVGGDSSRADQRSLAAKYAVSLILRGIGGLDPLSPPERAGDFELAMINADLAATKITGIPGGGAHKVLMWSFEKQGLRRQASAPTTQEGAPLGSDVYIEDGRNGEYLPFVEKYWLSRGIWNRNSADGGEENQNPTPNAANFLYVRVRNRGMKTGENVRVRLYQVRSGMHGQMWPGHWQQIPGGLFPKPSDTPKSLAPGETVILGPVQWSPGTAQTVLASISANDDLSNIDPGYQGPCALGPIPNSRLVPFDNNLAQRQFGGTPILMAGGGLLSRTSTELVVANPFEHSATAEVDLHLPEILRRRGWSARVERPSFQLDALEVHPMELQVTPGQLLEVAELARLNEDPMLHAQIIIDGQPTGGTSFPLNLAEIRAKSPAVTGFASAPTTVFFLARHAEKGVGDDPTLAPEGEARAKRLADMLSGSGIDVIVTSRTRRAIETARPLATRLGIAVREESQEDPAALVRMLRSDSAGKRIVIVGHTNTIPAILGALGVDEAVVIQEGEFDNLFTVVVGGPRGESPVFLRIKY